MFLDKPCYYDAPDGEQPVEKIVALAKRGLVGGLLIGTMDCLYYTDTKTALQSAHCYAYWVVPMVGMGTAFAAVTYAATKIRQKDDAKNYALGALSCAPILHSWMKSTRTTLWGTVCLMAFAVTFKHKEQAGLKYFQEVPPVYGHYLWDFSRTKDVDKDWKPHYIKSTF